MKLSLTFATAFLLSMSIPSAMAGDAAAGEQAFLAKGCIGCHGPGGHSANPDVYPATAGKDEAFLVEQLKAFRAGDRSNPLMSPMAAALTDEDIANLAAYLSAQK